MRRGNDAELGQHVNFKLVDGRVITHSTAERRRLARCVLRVSVGFALLVFRLVDSHLHLAAAEGRHSAAELVRRIKLSVGSALHLPVPFDRAHFEPIRDQRHLGSSAD